MRMHHAVFIVRTFVAVLSGGVALCSLRGPTSLITARCNSNWRARPMCFGCVAAKFPMKAGS